MRDCVPPNDAANVFLAAATHEVFVGIQQSLKQERKRNTIEKLDTVFAPTRFITLE
jgi:hypothetical protein